MSDNAKKRQRRAQKRGYYRKRQRETSIFYLLWAAFSLLTFLTILLFSGAQAMMMVQTYELEAAKEVADKGRRIRREVGRLASMEDKSAYVHHLSLVYDVNVFILSADGEMLFPLDISEVAPDGEFDFSDEVAKLKQKLSGTDDGSIVYEGKGEYVYGAEISLYERTQYLYVSKSLALIHTTVGQISTRMILLAIFIFIIAFALASAVSGWFVRPLAEITEKARKLGSGDFNVDFHSNEYGREMVELANTLNYARDEISKADDMQKELIANVSHDFKTPLTMIKAYASMIMEISGDIPEKRNKHAQVIVDEADRLASLVGDVLDLSKLRSGISTLDIITFDLSKYLLEILDRFAYLRDTKNYTFVTKIDERIRVNADKLKIGQALYNLIGNAVNYTGEDNTVFVTLKKDENGFARFEVRDTGKGIKTEELSTIWDRYYRSKETHKRPVSGTGLGLSIVKTVLERHGLQFGALSQENEGSTFFVVFPTTDEAEND